MTSVSIDFETRSTIDLKKAGVYRYAQDATTDLWCFAFSLGDEEPELWHPGLPFPDMLRQHIAEGGEMRAFNASFERTIWREIGVPRYAFPEVLLEQWVCTAAEAAAMALPRSLDECARVVGSAHQKDNDGHNNMLRMCRPRSKPEQPLVWWTDPARVQKLYEYCKQDVRTERSLLKSLRRLTPREREIYLLDQRINDRGIMCDRSLIVAAKQIVVRDTDRANEILAELTDGKVTKVTQSARLLTWVREQGVETSNLAKPTRTELLEDPNLIESVRQALETRDDSGKSSVAKLDAMLNVASEDGVMRGLLLYHAASTGRWGGMRVQPQNFPRGEVLNVESFIPYVLAGDYEHLDLFHPPMAVISSMLRSMLIARPGHDLIAADFSAIEARVLNWLAGQNDILDLFRMMDAGDDTKHPYKRMAVSMGRGKHPSDILKPSEDYQAGKAAELGCGFQMGWKKFIEAAWRTYQVRVDEKQSQDAVRAYRSTHPGVVQLWDDANSAALEAVASPGSTQCFGALRNLIFTCRGSYLYLVLPSKRPLCYAAPKIIDHPTPWGDVRPAVEVSGVDSYTHQWGRYQLYGGLITENFTQAVARDMLAEAMLRCESKGYLVNLTCHDELVAEVPRSFGTVQEFESLMEVLPEWAAGCPVKAEGWRSSRYKK